MLIQNIFALAALGLTPISAAPSPSSSSDPSSSIDRPCGFKTAPCPTDQKCVPTSPKCTNLDKCAGTCQWKNQYASCGGFRVEPPKPCPKGFECKDDPRNPTACGMACDMPGVCLPKKVNNCGGFAGLQCPYGLFCYDVPNDGCDPKKGGADCIGICV